MTEYQARTAVSNIDWQKVGNALETIIAEFKPLLTEAKTDVELLDEDTIDDIVFKTPVAPSESSDTADSDKA